MAPSQRRRGFLKGTSSTVSRNEAQLDSFPTLRRSAAEKANLRRKMLKDRQQRLQDAAVSPQLEDLRVQVIDGTPAPHFEMHVACTDEVAHTEIMDYHSMNPHPARCHEPYPELSVTGQVNDAYFTPSRSGSFTATYGSEAFKNRFARRSELNMPLPCENAHLRTFTDSTLLRHNRDVPSVDERRVARAPCLLPAAHERKEGLNGEREDFVFVNRKMKCSDITKFQSRSIDPHAVTQAMVKTHNHKMIYVCDGCSGQHVKAQLRKLDHDRSKNVQKKAAAGRPTIELTEDDERLPS